VDLHIVNERPELSGMPRPLRTLDMIDLSDYGRPRQHGRLDSLSAGVTTRLLLPETKIVELVAKAMTWMTEDADFTGATFGRPSQADQQHGPDSIHRDWHFRDSVEAAEGAAGRQPELDGWPRALADTACLRHVAVVAASLSSPFRSKLP
jgi:hypothetical protein